MLLITCICQSCYQITITILWFLSLVSLVLLCLVLLGLVLSCLVLSCLVLFRLVFSRLVSSYLVLSGYRGCPSNLCAGLFRENHRTGHRAWITKSSVRNCLSQIDQWPVTVIVVVVAAVAAVFAYVFHCYCTLLLLLKLYLCLEAYGALFFSSRIIYLREL